MSGHACLLSRFRGRVLKQASRLNSPHKRIHRGAVLKRNERNGSRGHLCSIAAHNSSHRENSTARALRNCVCRAYTRTHDGEGAGHCASFLRCVSGRQFARRKYDFPLFQFSVSLITPRAVPASGLSLYLVSAR